ncbi:helix-turn-helix domain-containing protein [Bacillus paranthracis]|uniref:helix-turn-helix domain-containing protein n=1 Tax=Bacillus paranthracis TaxID=2026186 RepID=UPI001581A94E|nr:helix-turn-helix transcriptional regulator [Bacillus paranthracis]NUJ09872.1 XRE family transcriptional regulator [Bacillus paranthracis]NUJ09879.1 XRE family transcriptional regulator [Bacillus paranthracis]
MKMNLDLDNLPIHKQLRVRRCYDDLTQAELVMKMGLSYYDTPMLSRIEKGHVKQIPPRFVEPINNYLYGEEGVKEDEPIGV